MELYIIRGKTCISKVKPEIEELEEIFTKRLKQYFLAHYSHTLICGQVLFKNPVLLQTLNKPKQTRVIVSFSNFSFSQISAQESRRKKKEYMDTLEKK